MHIVCFAKSVSINLQYTNHELCNFVYVHLHVFFLRMFTICYKIRQNPPRSYLFVCAFECEEHVAHVARDEDHGGKGHAPADPLTPGWEYIFTHCERDHLHCTKQEDPLYTKETREEDLIISHIISKLWNCTAFKPR